MATLRHGAVLALSTVVVAVLSAAPAHADVAETFGGELDLGVGEGRHHPNRLTGTPFVFPKRSLAYPAETLTVASGGAATENC